MSPIQILKDLGLLCWSVIYLGLPRGWANREDAIDYAVSLLLSSNNDENVALIADGESLDDEELFKLISNQIESTDNVSDFEKWRLAYLLNIAMSQDDEQTKLDKLQEVYADFGYPEDMASCSVYSQDEVDPLVAMVQVIEELRGRLKGLADTGDAGSNQVE